MKETMQEELLDKMIGVLEGPVNKLGEKVLGSKLVLAPMSISLGLAFRALAFVAGRKKQERR
jgi:hypothetical protein